MTVVPTAVRPVSVGREFSTSEPSAGDSMLGGGGVTSEMVTATGAAGSETFPARSAARALNRWVPAVSSLGGLQLKAPLPFALAWHSAVPASASVTVTALRASALPLRIGRCFRLGEAS